MDINTEQYSGWQYYILCSVVGLMAILSGDEMDRMSSLTNTLASLHHIMEEIGGEERWRQ